MVLIFVKNKPFNLPLWTHKFSVIFDNLILNLYDSNGVFFNTYIARTMNMCYLWCKTNRIIFGHKFTVLLTKNPRHGIYSFIQLNNYWNIIVSINNAYNLVMIQDFAFVYP